MPDKALRYVAKCMHCGKAKNMHRAFSLDCPTGKRTRIGYTTFGPGTFTPAPDPATGSGPAPAFSSPPLGGEDD